MMLESLIQLLEQYPQDITTSLVVSSAAHSFCKHKRDCKDYEQLINIVELFEKRVLEAYETDVQDKMSTEMVNFGIYFFFNIIDFL